MDSNTQEVLREVEDFPKSDIALIEIGDCEKESYVTLKGSLQGLHNEPAHTYYYPEYIGTQDILWEIKDLMEHYAHVALLTPLPGGWSLEDFKGNITPCDAEASQCNMFCEFYDGGGCKK